MNESYQGVPVDLRVEILQAQVRLERQQWEAFMEAVDHLVEAAEPVARFGDGCGGACLEEIKRAFIDAFGDESSGRSTRKKQLSWAARKKIMERDRFRCVTCDTWLDLCVAHIVPAREGGTDHMDNLHTLCRDCFSGVEA